MNGSELLLTVPGGSNHDPSFGGVNNSVRVMQTVGNGDFTIEVKFDSIPTSQYQFEGIIVQQDANNYLRCQFGSAGSILVVGVDTIISQVESQMFSPVISIPSGARSLWMRLKKAGNTWTQTWSADGNTYNTAGSFTQPLNVSSVGPFAGNYGSTASVSPAFTASIDYFNGIASSAPIPMITDNFNISPLPSSGGLNTNIWTLVNPAGGSYSLNGTDLLLTAPGGSNHDPSYGGVNNAVRVMQAVGNSDFTVEVKFDSIPISQYQFEGIIIQQDAANYLRFQFGSTGSILVTGADTMLSKVENQLFSPVITIPSGTSSLWMRVQRSGSTWTESWSADGKTYNTAGSFVQALTVSNIGPFSGNYNNTPSIAPAFTSAVDYFVNATSAAPLAPASDNFNK
jgi:regulation of enolase protein 1 (concanavalin A-like superfamily)